MVILDTNIVIDHLRIASKESSLLDALFNSYKSTDLAISILSIQELYQGKTTRIKSEEDYMQSVISQLTILPYNYELASFAGQIARDFKDSIEFVDAAIAATCIIYNADLYTLNTKHFKDIKNLNLLEI